MITIDQQMELAKNFFESNRKGSKASDPCYFRLTHLRNLNGERKFTRGNPIFYSNMDEPDMEESLALLKQAIELYGPTGCQYMLLSLVKSETSNNDYCLTITNPYYYSAGGGGIAGIGNHNPYQSQNLVMDIQRQMYEMQMMFKLQIQQMETEKILREKDEEIENLRGTKKNVIDSIQGFVETAPGQKLLDTLLGFLQPNNKMIPAPVQQQVIQQVPVQENQQQNQNMQMTPEVQESANKISQALYNLSQVFPDVEDALQDISNYCITHPNMAITLRNQNRQQNGTGA